jgi:hypothetical protein
MSPSNNHIVLVMGRPSSGKSTSLRNIANPSGVAYLNTDLKALPFKSDFKVLNITDAMDIHQAIQELEAMDDIHTVVLDTITFLMDQYEQQYVVTATNTQQAWGSYAQFYKSFIHAIKSSNKNYIIMAHEKDVMNEKEMAMEVKIPIKGSVGHTGAEADFTTIISTKKMPISKLQDIDNKLFSITTREEAVGFKHVFQTYLTKDTVNEKMRSAMGLWDDSELYIDNDINLVIQRLHEYYG